MIMNGMSRKRQDGNERIEYSTKDSNKQRGKVVGDSCLAFKTSCFHNVYNFIISQPCSLELCLYKVKRGNFGITVQKYPHTQQHIIHKAPRLYITKIYIDRTWSVQCIIQLLFRNWGFPELG